MLMALAGHVSSPAHRLLRRCGHSIPQALSLPPRTEVRRQLHNRKAFSTCASRMSKSGDGEEGGEKYFAGDDRLTISSNESTLPLGEEQNGRAEKKPFEPILPASVLKRQPPLGPSGRETVRLGLKLDPKLEARISHKRMINSIRNSMNERAPQRYKHRGGGIYNSAAGHRAVQDESSAKAREAVETSSMAEAEQAILIVSSTSPNLERSDFERCQPVGKHMNWSNYGHFVQVIPLRTVPTLEKTGSYLVIFRSMPDYREFNTTVHRLHNISRQHSPASLLSRLTPPPGYIQNDVDTYSIMQDYTLMPPIPKAKLHPCYDNQHKHLSQNARSSNKAIKQLWRLGNYSELATRVELPPVPGVYAQSLPSVFADPNWDDPRRREHKVLFWVEGRQPTMSQIMEAIRNDGAERGLHWKYGRERDQVACINSWRTHRPVEEEEGETREERMSRRAAQRREWEVPPKWKIVFASESEARRFSRTWDGRMFPWAELKEDDCEAQPGPTAKGQKGGETTEADLDVIDEAVQSTKSGVPRMQNMDDLVNRVYAEYIWT